MTETPLYDVAVIGAGYVGVPLAATFAEAGQRVARSSTCSRQIVDALNRGESHIEDVPHERLAPLVDERARSSRRPTTSRSSRRTRS